MEKGLYKDKIEWRREGSEYLLDQNPETGSSWANYALAGHTVQWVLSEKPRAGTRLSYTGEVVIDGKRISKQDSLGVVQNKEKEVLKMAQKKTEVKVRRLNKVEHGSTRAFADIETPEFVIKGYRVVENKDGELFVSDPSQPSEDGKWYKQAYAKEDALKDAINEAVLAEYNK